MATIIETSHGFIAGDPPDEFTMGHHWCAYCGGDGLEHDYDGELTICMGCFGACTVDCTDTGCLTHSTLHPRAAYQDGPSDTPTHAPSTTAPLS